MSNAEINLIFWGGLGLLLLLGIYYGRRREKKRAAEAGACPPLEDWFKVSYDAECVHLDVTPPDKKPWQARFRWGDIIRICYGTKEMFVSDGIYFFTSARPESYAVPIEAQGGAELWDEVIRRGLFDPRLAIEAACCAEEKLFCWPPDPARPGAKSS